MTQSTNELSLLEQLKNQHAEFCKQRDQIQANAHQINGAIYACEVMIKKHEDAQQESINDDLGRKEHGEVIE